MPAGPSVVHGSPSQPAKRTAGGRIHHGSPRNLKLWLWSRQALRDYAQQHAQRTLARLNGRQVCGICDAQLLNSAGGLCCSDTLTWSCHVCIQSKVLSCTPRRFASKTWLWWRKAYEGCGEQTLQSSEIARKTMEDVGIRPCCSYCCSCRANLDGLLHCRQLLAAISWLMVQRNLQCLIFDDRSEPSSFPLSFVYFVGLWFKYYF